jgi:hypothetical protein
MTLLTPKKDHPTFLEIPISTISDNPYSYAIRSQYNQTESHRDRYLGCSDKVKKLFIVEHHPFSSIGSFHDPSPGYSSANASNQQPVNAPHDG